MEQSGARLVEVGTTNRTRAADYQAATERDEVALLLKVHPSNYRITGFTEETGVAELAKIGPPVVSDLGSGLLDERCPWLGQRPDWLAGEPGARQTLAAGAALVTFSGDKLMGGPQAGIICGRADLIAACAAHPLMRAFRPGSLVLDALQSVALAYLRPRRRRDPVLANGQGAGRGASPARRGARRGPAVAHDGAGGCRVAARPGDSLCGHRTRR